MPFYFDVRQSQHDADKDASNYNKTNYKTLLGIYRTEINSLLAQFGGQEADIPMGHKYFILKNKYQYVDAKFSKE